MDRWLEEWSKNEIELESEGLENKSKLGITFSMLFRRDFY